MSLFLLYPSIRLNKLSLCPPVAVKNQVNAPQGGARGFRDVTVRNDTGDVVSRLVWLDESPGRPTQPLPDRGACSEAVPTTQAPR